MASVQTTKTWSIPGPRAGTFVKTYYNQSWNTKSGVHKIDLRSQNPHTFRYRKALISNPVSDGGGFYPDCPDANFPIVYIEGNPPPQYPEWLNIEQAALSKFNGRLKHGSASLGVTLAEWRASREMIVSRLGSLDQVLKVAEKRLSKKKFLRKSLSPSSLANKVLEVEFGWMPLLQDIQACMGSVCKEAIPPSWCVGRHSGNVSRSLSDPGSKPWTPPASDQIDATLKVTVAASVAITNPNVWLLNRLGLINPATVLWDIVPWSFVVNMFVNVNQIIESYTAYVGLKISNQSITRSSLAVRNSTRGPTSSDYVYQGKSSSLTTEKNRLRTTGAIPVRQLSVRVPELNWELALIASSLVVQRMSRITKLIS